MPLEEFVVGQADAHEGVGFIAYLHAQGPGDLAEALKTAAAPGRGSPCQPAAGPAGSGTSIGG